MAEDELRMLIHLAVSAAQSEQKINARLDKLEQNIEVLHRNNATMSALLNDMLEQGRIENNILERLRALELSQSGVVASMDNIIGLINQRPEEPVGDRNASDF